MVKKCAYFKGFTLAEVMIVLTVIGVLTAILLPVARQSMPDENLMKFKKAHNTLGTVIRELVTSDKYYLNGDLTTRPDGTLVDGTHDGDNQYLCLTVADVLNTKKVDCKDTQSATGWFGEGSIKPGNAEGTIEFVSHNMDEHCLQAQEAVGEEIVTSDNIVFFDCNPNIPFGIKYGDYKDKQGLENSGYRSDYTYFKIQNNFNAELENSVYSNLYRVYKFFCIDIDGINKGEDPFGYGIRWDGKIIAGARAQEWLAKEVMEE